MTITGWNGEVMRRTRSALALAAFLLVVPAAPAMAAPTTGQSATSDNSPVFFVSSGELATRQEGKITFNLASSDYTGSAHSVGYWLLSRWTRHRRAPWTPAASWCEPSPVRHQLSRCPTGPTCAAPSPAITAVALTPGSDYEVLIKGEGQSAGAYQLSAYLAGDANGDFQVNQDDLTLINSLSGTKYGKPGYSPWADLDRNGVINQHDRMLATPNLGAATQLRLTAENPLDVDLPANALAIDGVTAQGFNPVSAPVAFTLSGSEFFDDPAEVDLTVNGARVPANRLTVGAHQITATSALINGRNDIHFAGVDTVGRSLYHQATVWAGANTLRVYVVDETGAPVTDEVSVRVSLSDDQSVSAENSTATGQLTFANLPSRTVLVKATASGNRWGTVGLHAGQGSVQVKLIGFSQPSTIANNDFSQGTAGWQIGSAPVWISPHQEGIPGQAAGLNALKAQRAEPPLMTPAAQSSKSAATGTATNSSIVDNDLVLNTRGEGEQAISRTFTTEPDVSAVRIRYRFITSEVPGGYYGSQWNDYFRVSLRSQLGAGASTEANSMNGMGLGQFDYASGATGWRELTLPVDKAGDTIQADLAVANVGDGLFDSQVVVDFVEEVRDQIQPSLSWNNTQGGMNLRYTVESGELKQAATIDVYWANGSGYANRLGTPIFSQTVPAGTAAGQHGPVHIAGSLLANDPSGVSHLIAVASPTRVDALADVQVNYGANANQASLGAATIDIVKDSLRAAGQASVTITSTARTPADQARAMFQNLTNAANPISVNVTNQLALYAAAGDAVINVFVAQTQGLTRAQILANSATIQADMVAEINRQGPQNVSRHCADPNVVNVADIGSSAFNATNGPLFVNAIRPRVTRFIDERATNSCYHIEVVQ